MTAWLLSIVGVTVIGVLIELLLTDSPISKFIRTIYGFFVLLVIVYPLPGFFRTAQDNLINGEIPVNAGLMREIQNQTNQATATAVEGALSRNGFNDTIVVIFDGRIFINAYNSTNRDVDQIISIVTTMTNFNASQVEVFI